MLGYTTQARFLLNCGLLDAAAQAPTCARRAAAQKLMHEHEMGELFKVIGFARGGAGVRRRSALRAGDRSHTL